MLWPTTQLIENHWSSGQVDQSSLPRLIVAETRAWPSRQEAPQRVAEPANCSAAAQAPQDCGLLGSSR